MAEAVRLDCGDDEPSYFGAGQFGNGRLVAGGGIYELAAGSESEAQRQARAERMAGGASAKGGEEVDASTCSSGPGQPPSFLRPEERTRLIRAQQSLTMMKAVCPALLPPSSPCHLLNFDLVTMVAARNPQADAWAYGTYDVEIKWNGSYVLVLDERGAHWGSTGAVGPYSLNERRLCLTIYNPTASSEWSGRNGGEANQRGLTESLDIRLVSGGALSAAEHGQQSDDSVVTSFSGEFQREYEGALPCSGKRRPQGQGGGEREEA
jgi:hypothetical protein